MPSTSSLSPTIVTVDLSALTHNLNLIRRRLPASCGILAIIKANAYGHGAAQVAAALGRSGVTRFGVATLEEGRSLRQAGIRASILVTGALFPEQITELLAHELTPVIYDRATADRLAEGATSRRAPYPVHIKVETGMNRLGLSPDQVLPLLQSPPFKGPLKAEGLMTHLADSDNQDPGYTQTQLARFRSVATQLDAAGLGIPLVHAANSAAILCHPDACFTAVRPGIMLYGYQTAAHCQPAPDLRPVLTLATKVAQVRSVASGESVSYNRTYAAPRPSRIAVLPIGYADGYSRSLSNRGAVLINGRRAPIAGRVCMDMTMVDVTDIPDVAPGTDVVVIGQQGGLQITAADLAAWQGTIPYEVLCAIGLRVPRVYRDR